MRKILPFLIAILLITSCSEDDSDNDLTGQIVGVYNINGFPNDGIITVEKVNNNTINIYVLDNVSDLITNYSFLNTKLNSETSFSLNEFIYESAISQSLDTVCYIENVYRSSGSLSQNAINLSINQTVRPATFDPCPQNLSALNINRTVNLSGQRQ